MKKNEWKKTEKSGSLGRRKKKAWNECPEERKRDLERRKGERKVDLVGITEKKNEKKAWKEWKTEKMARKEPYKKRKERESWKEWKEEKDRTGQNEKRNKWRSGRNDRQKKRKEGMKEKIRLWMKRRKNRILEGMKKRMKRQWDLKEWPKKRRKI